MRLTLGLRPGYLPAMPAEIIRTQVRSIVSSSGTPIYRLVDTVTESDDTSDLALFRYRTVDSTYNTVCTPYDLSAYPATRNAAIAANAAYSRQTSVQLDFTTAKAATDAADSLDRRFQVLAADIDAGAADYPGTDTITVTSTGAVHA